MRSANSCFIPNHDNRSIMAKTTTAKQANEAAREYITKAEVLANIDSLDPTPSGTASLVAEVNNIHPRLTGVCMATAFIAGTELFLGLAPPCHRIRYR
ncbi:hypothetical protein B0H12DRAFT_207218 [Mycena haematopus]|nr:hypothetical protein B0H12DRAFT_207218 [Mycena haematopus]